MKFLWKPTPPGVLLSWLPYSTLISHTYLYVSNVRVCSGTLSTAVSERTSDVWFHWWQKKYLLSSFYPKALLKGIDCFFGVKRQIFPWNQCFVFKSIKCDQYNRSYQFKLYYPFVKQFLLYWQFHLLKGIRTSQCTFNTKVATQGRIKIFFPL